MITHYIAYGITALITLVGSQYVAYAIICDKWEKKGKCQAEASEWGKWWLSNNCGKVAWGWFIAIMLIHPLFV